MLVKDLVDNQNLVVIQSDGDGILMGVKYCLTQVTYSKWECCWRHKTGTTYNQLCVMPSFCISYA